MENETTNTAIIRVNPLIDDIVIRLHTEGLKAQEYADYIKAIQMEE